MEQEVKLERKLNPLNVWALALGSIIGWGAFVMPGTTFLPKAGVLGTLIGIIIAIFIMSTIAINCGYMVQKYPVAGGGYAFTKFTHLAKHCLVCDDVFILELQIPTVVCNEFDKWTGRVRI